MTSPTDHHEEPTMDDQTEITTPSGRDGGTGEGLADLLMDATLGEHGFGDNDFESTEDRREGCVIVARAILDSDWLRDREAAAATRARAEALREAAHEIRHSVSPEHPNPGYRDGHAHAAWVVESLDPAPRGDGAGA